MIPSWSKPKKAPRPNEITDEFRASITCLVCGSFLPNKFIRHSNGTKARLCNTCFLLLYKMFELSMDHIIETAFRHKSPSEIDLFFRIMNKDRA